MSDLESKQESSLRWYDRKILPFMPAYSSSMFQVVVLSLVCFMTTGMYNALTGIGGSGITIGVANNGSTALYIVFCVWGFFSGYLCNMIGVKLALCIGSCGYCLYSGALSTNPGGAEAFIYASSAILGACAGTLWSAQGSIMMSYPPEEKKGRAIMIFWVIFNLGGVVGSAISLGNNLKNNESTATDSTYAVFIALMGSGLLFALGILPAHKVWKYDVGEERVVSYQYPHWKSELASMFRMLYKEPKIYLMFPMFFASNWFYTYHFNDVNAARFNIRTRSLNSLLYWLSQMVGAFGFGLVLDWERFNRKTRTKIAWGILMALTLAIWGGGLKFQLQYTRESVMHMELYDYKHRAYIGPMFLYIFYGMYDAIFQNFIYYLLGAISNNPKKTAIYGAFYKSIQSAGAAIMWRLDYYEIPYINMFASCWALCAGSVMIAFPLAFFMIQNHTDVEDDDLNGEMVMKQADISCIENTSSTTEK
ncbi:MFS general substrate transporter [Yamadazyma tenuis ATCC 10573]|uniref:MFS general substrate transporter n=1 Tax=Candida tenuis (strain ATCC 10573 / BCRC 21748 / CBS 615 / JCM 9827 / NBRC 10315 / NRRL Y-1498 / VKM Y-70) TaxID=590646 RepID=G3BEU7_CANTC|nr:MFS general substrate transporter [Yamadazyma tenuis ATCC 10573]EGV60596.1 MFS general substrate transporter [Yamadazyma tenuis ATCC 10573]